MGADVIMKRISSSYLKTIKEEVGKSIRLHTRDVVYNGLVLH